MWLLVQLWKIEDTFDLPPLLLHFREREIPEPVDWSSSDRHRQGFAHNSSNQ
jgi:hypothetical protein